MSQRAYLRDMTLIFLVAAAIIVLIGTGHGLLVAVLALVIAPLATVAIVLAHRFAAWLDSIDDTEEYCARLDEQLDQEHAARRQLRVIRTVRAEPQPAAAVVVDLFTREPVDAA